MGFLGGKERIRLSINSNQAFIPWSFIIEYGWFEESTTEWFRIPDWNKTLLETDRRREKNL